MGAGDPLKETKNMLEDENGKQVRKITEGKLKKKEMPRDKGGNGYVLTLKYYIQGSLATRERIKYFK